MNQTIRAIFIGFLALYGATAWFLAGMGNAVFESLHIALDASNAMLAGLFSLFVWITAAIGKERSSRAYLAVGFALAAVAELLHALIGIEWGGGLAWIRLASQVLRPATWPPSTYFLPIAMGLALWAERRRMPLSHFMAGLLLAFVTLYAVFLNIASYRDIGFAAIHRPYQLPVLLLLAVVGYSFWKQRDHDRLFSGLACCIVFLFISDGFMLFSTAPHEKWTMVAHVGKLFGYLLAHTVMMEIARDDIAARNCAEQELGQQSRSLTEANRSLQAEILERRRSEQALHQMGGALEATVAERTRELLVANQALQHQARFNEQLADGFPGIFYLLDDHGLLRRWNARFEAVSGFRADELDGKPALDFFDGSEKEQVTDRIAAVFKDGQSDLQADFLARNGQRIPYYFSGRRIALDGSDCLIGLGLDISDRKRAEDALAAVSYRNELLLRMASDGIHILDAQGRLLEASEAFASLLGYERNELLGTYRSRWDAVGTPEELEDMLARRAKSMLVFETRYRRRDGSEIDVEVNASAIELDGKPVLFCSGRDISERKCREERNRIRHRIFELLSGDGSLSETLDLAAQYVEKTTEGLLCSILIFDESRTRLMSAAAPSLPDYYIDAINGLEIGDGICCSGTAAYRKERAIVENISGHPHWRKYRDLAASAGLASCWSEPIRDSNGEVLGAFAIYRRHPVGPSQADIELGQEAATLAGIAIERKRIDEALQLASSVYQASAEAIIVTDSGNRIVAVNPAFTRLTGYASKDVLGKDPKMLGSGRTTREVRDAMWQSLCAAGQWQGEIWNRRKDGEEYVEWLAINVIHDDQGRVHRYIGMFSDITEKKRIEELIWRQANYDALTGLPNRRLFLDRLQQESRRMLRAGRHLALLFIDLDHFKVVNDSLGHDMGDLLLIEAARRIAGCVRDSDTVARLGGDEFVAILPNPPERDRVEQIARNILESLAAPFQLCDHITHVSASIGIAFSPVNDYDIKDLIKSADKAMYLAKEDGRNGFACSAGGEQTRRPNPPSEPARNPARIALRTADSEGAHGNEPA